jgi:hypothetical protein
MRDLDIENKVAPLVEQDFSLHSKIRTVIKVATRSIKKCVLSKTASLPKMAVKLQGAHRQESRHKMSSGIKGCQGRESDKPHTCSLPANLARFMSRW